MLIIKPHREKKITVDIHYHTKFSYYAQLLPSRAQKMPLPFLSIPLSVLVLIFSLTLLINRPLMTVILISNFFITYITGVPLPSL